MDGYGTKLYKTIMKYRIIIIFALTALCFVGCENQKSENEFESAEPVNLTSVLQTYELYEKSDGETKDSITFSIIDWEGCDEEIYLFEDNSFVLCVPEYNKSKEPFLAQAEDYFNACAFAWNVWSNYEVWYRSHTSDELRSDNDIMQCTRGIKAGIIKDAALRKAAENYRDSMILLMTIPIDEWDEMKNPGRVFDSFSNIIEGKQPDFIDDKESFQSQYDSLILDLEDWTDRQFKHYLDTTPENRLKVMLTELNSCLSFGEQCSLWMNWGNCKESRYDSSWLVLVGKTLLESGKYSPLLNRMWIAWRALCQADYFGLSRDSSIPNNMYNEYRRKCYLACLKWIENNPEDVFAMNCALSLAGSPNVNRFGSNIAGNEAMMELYNMMPERLNYDEDE